ncbi:Tripartite tricarboxylate transporter family receptor [Rhodospirillales bacterium URHD0017]|nr:Tripartite tricarboxylate transporter family receptor [Rhodospirillales bacterium URHD0017]
MIRILATVIAALLLAGGAAAQGYPNRPLQILVGYGPGGGTDIMARVLAGPLGKALGPSVVVRNIPGAGGQIAATALLNEGGDGHAILAINHPDLLMTVDSGNAPYKAADFQVIMVDVKDPRVLPMLSGEVTANLGDDFGRYNLRDRVTALFLAAQDKSPRWPEAQTLTAALEPFGVKPPSPNFLARYGIYVVPASFKLNDPAKYEKLQKALLQARQDPQFQEYLAKNELEDLSIGRRGEDFEAAFAADMAELRQMNR